MANHAAVSLKAQTSAVQLNFIFESTPGGAEYWLILANIGRDPFSSVGALRRPSWLRTTFPEGAQGGIHDLLE